MPRHEPDYIKFINIFAMLSIINRYEKHDALHDILHVLVFSISFIYSICRFVSCYLLRLSQLSSPNDKLAIILVSFGGKKANKNNKKKI